MHQTTLNRIFGTIFAAGLLFVIALPLYSNFPASATEGIHRQLVSTDAAPKDQTILSAPPKYPSTFIPPLGLGTWLSSTSSVASAVSYALQLGYRHLDCAKAYGNEKEVGEGIRQSKIPRTEIWITSKLFNDDHHPKDVEPAIRKTLSDLGVDYLDLYLMHWPVAVEDGQVDRSVNYTQTYAAMEKLVTKGLTKNIGISNFAKHEVEDILASCTIRPAAHEFELHPYLQQPSFVSWHQAQGIQVIAYSPFANLNPVYDPDRRANPPTAPLLKITQDPFWLALAAEKNITVPQAILAWHLQRGTVVIPKSVNPEHIRENFAVELMRGDVRFGEGEMREIAGRDVRARYNNPGPGWGVDLFDDLDGVYGGGEGGGGDDGKGDL